MKKVKTVGIFYIPGERSLTQRHKKGERPHYGKNGAYVNPTGFGYATETKPSKLMLTVDTGEGTAQFVLTGILKNEESGLLKREGKPLLRPCQRKFTLSNRYRVMVTVTWMLMRQIWMHGVKRLVLNRLVDVYDLFVDRIFLNFLNN